jgi:zinc protease
LHIGFAKNSRKGHHVSAESAIYGSSQNQNAKNQDGIGVTTFQPCSHGIPMAFSMTGRSLRILENAPMWTRTTFLLLLCEVLMSNAVSHAKDKDIDIPYQKFVLANGLTLIVHEDHKAPIVAVNVWYHVGSKNEKPGKTGFAHLFEHLMFGGSEHANERYIDAIDRIGATDRNGTTSCDRTNYFQNVPTSALDYTLWLESDRMGHLLGAIDQERLDLQRGVVQNEKRQGENQPYGIVNELITKNTYPAGHPYSWTVIGEMADLDAASMKDVQEWFRTYYGPSNVVLVLAGDIDAQTAKEKVEKYFGDIPPGPPIARHQTWIAKMTGTHRATAQDRVPQAKIYKTWNVPEYGSADADYLGLVVYCMGVGKTSRFYKRLVYDDQIATEAYASLELNEIAGQFYAVATARQEKDLAQVEKAMDEELARFLKDGPTAEELQRVKMQSESTFIRRIERIGGFGGKSDHLAQNEVFLGNPEAYKTTLKRIREATVEDLKAAANRWLSDGVFILDVHPFPEYKAAATGADRSKAPEIGVPPELKLPKMQRATLSNGLRIILAERHEVPLVNFWMAGDAGYAADPSTSPGTADMTMLLLNGGTNHRSALQISDQLALLGAQFQAYSNLDLSTAWLSALHSQLDASLDLYADMILHPTFPESDFRLQQKQQLAAIKLEENTPDQMAFRVLPRLIYGEGHPYGNSLTGTGTTESISKMTREDLVKFHQTWIRPNNATLVITGDTTLAEITPKLEKIFADWKPAQTPKKEFANVSLQPKTLVYLMDKPDAKQSIIIVGSVAPPTANPQEIAIEAMNNGLGGMFASRINLNLREDKHWCYGARSLLVKARCQRPFLTITAVQADKTHDSMAEIQREFRQILGERPISPEELKNIQSNETLKLPGSRETLSSVGNSIIDLTRYGLPDDYYETYAGKVRALTPHDVLEAATTVVHPDNLIWVIVGDRVKIEAGIKSLNLGEIRYLSPEGRPL